MKITDIMSITELSRLINKSRPTVYKYLTDFEAQNFNDIPETVKTLFEKVINNEYGKKEIYNYCSVWFGNESISEVTLINVIRLIQENKDRLDLKKLEKYILKEIGE